ncbi:MAG: hypothetical protein K9J06_08990 [Flavobacteriales bacterium]|nr:hypothetical protein [Flavobacteriales bacterium]
METIVYISTPSEILPPINAYAIRTGLILSTSTYAVGCAYMGILYDVLTKEVNRNLVRKIEFLKNHGAFENQALDSDQLIKEVKRLSNLKRDKNALKQYLMHEHHITAIYDAYNSALTEGMRNFSLLQLACLKDSDELIVLGFDDPNKGEEHVRNFRISKMLTLKLDPEGSPGPYAFILIDKLAKLPPEDEAGLVHVFNLPNINILTIDQLMVTRKALGPAMGRLHRLLIPDAATIGQYGGGRWDRALLAETGKAIQHAIDGNSDLNWAISINPQFRSSILVGEMDAHRFWQLQRDCDQVPDDSWEALQNLSSETPYPRTIPIIVVRPNLVLSDEKPVNDLDSLQYRRKTISLD